MEDNLTEDDAYRIWLKLWMEVCMSEPEQREYWKNLCRKIEVISGYKIHLIK